jgi:hypothetical protein
MAVFRGGGAPVTESGGSSTIASDGTSVYWTDAAGVLVGRPSSCCKGRWCR